MVVIEMENGKKIKIELYPEIAPITCANFEKLVKEGFYDGLIFHRVISGFMIQGGDPEGTGMGGRKGKHQGRICSERRKERFKAHKRRYLYGSFDDARQRKLTVLYNAQGRSSSRRRLCRFRQGS